MQRLLLIAPAAVLLMGGGVAPASSPSMDDQTSGSPRVCFLPQSVRNYRPDGDTTVYVRDLRGRVFEIQTGGCRGLSHSRTFAVSPADGGGACVGETVTIATTGPSIRGENNSICTARVARVLDEEQVAALPGSARP